MEECSQGSCKEIKDVEDKVDDVKDSMITQKTAMWVIGILVTVLILYGGGIVRANISSTKNTTHFEHIQKSLDELKTSQLTKGDIYKAIRKAMNKDGR